MIGCARCGTPIPTPTGRRARKRYCSQSCRKAAWRDRHRDDLSAPDIVPDIVPDVVPPAVSHIVPDSVVVPTASRHDVASPGGQHRCPHCHQPLAIISDVIPAAAAVAIPEAPMTTS